MNVRFEKYNYEIKNLISTMLFSYRYDTRLCGHINTLNYFLCEQMYLKPSESDSLVPTSLWLWSKTVVQNNEPNCPPRTFLIIVVIEIVQEINLFAQRRKNPLSPVLIGLFFFLQIWNFLLTEKRLKRMHTIKQDHFNNDI